MGFSRQEFWNELQFSLPGYPGGSLSKESACNVGDLGSIPGLGRSPREATNSSTIAWRISRTEEPGGSHSMGLQRAGHE